MGTDIEKNEKMAVAVVVDEPTTVSTSIYTTSDSATIGGKSVAGIGGMSVISIEPSVFQLATVGEIEDPSERKANLCCGCCCDLLRACIIVNILFIIFNIVGLLFSWLGVAWANSIDLSSVDDDDVMSDMNEIRDQSRMIFLIFLLQFACGIFFAIIGIFGAARFNGILVLSTAIWYCIDVLISGIFLNWTGAVLRGFFAYPHFALYLALKSKQITRKHYMRERNCCCDSPPQ